MPISVNVEHIIDNIGRQTGYRAAVTRQGRSNFDMDVTYHFNASGGVTGADVVKTYTGGYQYQMEITKFCPTVGTLVGYKVKTNGQETVLGSCP